MTTAPVHEADELSGRWKQRLIRESAAIGEEAITSDVVLALEERFAPYVHKVSSFNRAQEGGTRHARAIGADIEIHLVTPDGSRHLGYRVQAKLAKRNRSARSPLFDYDLNYSIGSGSQKQIDALIAAAGSCIPLYFLYNSPSAVEEILSIDYVWPNYFYRRWRTGRGCLRQHDMDLEAALTIGVVPARLARHQARLSSTHYVIAALLAYAITPWSCLFHQGEPAEVARPAAPSASHRLELARLRDAQRSRFLGVAYAVEQAPIDNRIELVRELRDLAETFNQDSGIPDDVSRLWRGEPGYDLDALALARLLPDLDGNVDVDQGGDMQLRSMLIIEVEP